MPQSVTVKESHRLASSNVLRMGRYDRTIIYQAGVGPVRSITLPDETFTEAAMLAAIKADLDSAAAVQGKTFQV